MEQFFRNHPLLVGTFVLLVMQRAMNRLVLVPRWVHKNWFVGEQRKCHRARRTRSKEFMEGHIVDAVNIPYASLRPALTNFPSIKRNR